MAMIWWKRAPALLATLAVCTMIAGGANAGAVQDGANEEGEAFTTAPLSSTGSCGVERWSVKTGTDADIGQVNLNSVTATTIASLGALAKPATLPANNRIAPTETTVFRLSGTFTQYKLENDSDYHLVVIDTTGHTMIVEIPDPACVGAASPLLGGIRASQAAFDAKYTATGSFQTANVPVTVTGIGFFDFLHGQTGVAPNGIELHAVTAIAFGTGGGNTVTVTNPGTQTSTAGTATTLQIQATDSAPSATLSYSATGLPAGLTINTASGLISGTPTTAGTSTTTVSASDTTGATGTTAFTWTINSPGCTGGGQRIGNPGFETGTAAPWTGTAVINSTGAEPPHTGIWDAWLDGHGATHTDALAQQVTLPAGCTTYTLTFWLHIDTAETTTSTAYDKLTVKIGATTLATYSNLNAAPGYTSKTFNLNAYAGQTVTVTFTGTEDYTKQTSFVLDDTAVNVS